jgi:hypothetical protein
MGVTSRVIGLNGGQEVTLQICLRFILLRSGVGVFGFVYSREAGFLVMI